MNLSDTAILNVKGADYRCIISGISKSEVINVMQDDRKMHIQITYKNG